MGAVQLPGTPQALVPPPQEPAPTPGYSLSGHRPALGFEQGVVAMLGGGGQRPAECVRL